jgi:hypothetical protein
MGRSYIHFKDLASATKDNADFPVSAVGNSKYISHTAAKIAVKLSCEVQ